MRTMADLQRGPGGPEPDIPAGLGLDVQLVRTFDTPEFAGMEFLEVETKTALNRVQGMPFGWSINPYRGCSHACSYCLAPGTPVLMADGRRLPISALRQGDRVYGTQRAGGRRQLTITPVLDHWETVKPAYRVRLSDGTALVASGDHRLLTDTGWKHVAAGTCWAGSRPYLSTGDKLPATEFPHVKVEAVEDLGIELPMFDITTGTGDFIAAGVVSHNCFARPSHSYLNMSPVGDFERRVVVKTNLVEVLRRELVRKSWQGEHVALGTNTDPYQRCEGRYRMMPGVIDALAEFLTPFSILTKGTLITRDVDRLAAAAERVEVSAALTIGMLDEALWREAEPGTPPPRARLEAVRALNAAGIPTGVMLAPIMPGLSDGRDQLAALVDAAAAAGASHITPIVLHLRRSGERGRGGPPRPPAWQSVREAFMPWLRDHHPELVQRYEDLYRGATASPDYRREIERFVAQRRQAAWRRHGHPERQASLRGSASVKLGAEAEHDQAATGAARTPVSEQLRLWS